MLVQHFLNLYGNKYGHPDLKISPEKMSHLIQHQWPGNVRELESVIRRIALDGNENSTLESLNATGVKTTSSAVADVIRDTEIQTILDALTEARWNRRKTAQLLGMSYSSLRRRIAKYDLKNH